MRSSLMKGKKAKSVWQQKEKKKSLLPISKRCTAASWEARTSARITVAQEHLDNGCPPFSPGFIAVWHHTVGDILLVSLGQLSWLCPLLTSSPPLDYWPLGVELGREPWCWASPAQQQPEHGCAINTVLATRAKRSAVWAAVGKGNSVPASPSTCTQRKLWRVNNKKLANLISLRLFPVRAGKENTGSKKHSCNIEVPISFSNSCPIDKSFL